LLGACLLVPTVFWTPANAAVTVTELSYVSQPGDAIGNGLSATYAPPTSTFSLRGTAGGIEVYVVTGSQWWGLRVAAPRGSQLRTGRYEGTGNGPAGHTSYPVLHFRGSDGDCLYPVGTFTISSMQADYTGNLTSLDVRFIQHCDSPDAPALTGRLRVNAPIDAPLIVTSSNPTSVGDEPVTFTAIAPSVATGSVTFSDDGAPIGSATIVDGLASITTDSLAPGTHSITAAYSGGADTPPVESSPVGQLVHDGANSFWFTSGIGDYIGGGATGGYGGPDGGFVIHEWPGVIHLISTTRNWLIRLSAPVDSQLVVGSYQGAEELATPEKPGINVSGNGHGCTSYGSFEITKLERDRDDAIALFDATFTQTCNDVDGPQLRGRVRVARPFVPFSKTTTTLSFDTPATYEREEEIVFHVTVAAADGTTPTGLVGIVSEGPSLCAITLNAGVGSCTMSPTRLEGGDHRIYAEYFPDTESFQRSMSRTAPFQVVRAGTEIAADPARLLLTPEYQYVILRATLTSKVTGKPAGLGQMVTFTMGNPLAPDRCVGYTDPSGVAVCYVEPRLIASIVASAGYDATFAGTKSYEPSSSHGLVSLT
jgi:hypothetical protein